MSPRRYARRSCVITPVTAPRPSDRVPRTARARRGARAGASSSRAVRPGQRHALARLYLEVERADGRRASLDDGVGETRRRRGDPPRRAELEPELPGLERLLGKWVALEEALRLTDLRHQRMRSAAVCGATARPCLGPAVEQERRQLAAPLLCVGESRVRRGAGRFPALRVRGSSRRPTRRSDATSGRSRRSA